MQTTPWYILVLSFIGSVLSGLFFLLFLGLSNLLDSPISNLGFGFVILVLTSVVSHKETNNQILEPVLFSFANQALLLFLFGVNELFNPSTTSLLFTILFFQLTLFLLFKNNLQKFFTLPNIFLCLVALLLEWDFKNFYPILTFLAVFIFLYLAYAKEFPIETRNLRIPASICFLGLYSFSDIPLQVATESKIASIVILVVAIFFVLHQTITKQSNIKITILWFALILFLFAPTFQTPGILASALVFFIGIKLQEKILQVLSVIALFAYFVTMYYQMEITLLHKSLYMLGSGFLFLSAFVLMELYERRQKRI
ncbi:DUF4401 domain-containing protein [Leptospira sp. 96542]|nr:DUF4401 domain-containing protein [Leptospira sp. 96542]